MTTKTKNKTKAKPLFVAISDIHFSVPNLELASRALRAAIGEANEQDIPLVIAGDLNDTKAIIRAEVANRLLDDLRHAETKVFLLVGNHDLINEKGKDHGLNYLSPLATLVDKAGESDRLPGVAFIPYQSTPEAFVERLHRIPKDRIIVCHQGVQGAEMGDYVVDNGAVPQSALEGYTLISGHYHKHQTVGPLTYIGSPYTMSFGEANDGPKGFLIVNDDGSFQQVPLHQLRRHVIMEVEVGGVWNGYVIRNGTPSDHPGDLLWVKLHGPASQLAKISKQQLGDDFFGHSNYKLDKIPDEATTPLVPRKDLSPPDIMDLLIEALPESQEYKDYLKKLWRSL